MTKGVYKITAEKNGMKLSTFTNDFIIAYDATKQLEAKGFQVRRNDWPDEVCTSVDQVMTTFNSFFR